MATAALTTIPSFKMVLFCKTSVSLWSEVVISVFYRDMFFKMTHNTTKIGRLARYLYETKLLTSTYISYVALKM